MKESLKSNRQGTRFFSNYLKEKKQRIFGMIALKMV